jgi:hypothetical protein
MEGAVRDRLVSDVPLGTFLSGGVDSSIVVGLMAKNSRKQVKTFTVGYNDAPLYDESGFAREVARHFGTEHSEIRLSLRDALAVIPDALDYLDQPFGDSSCIPTYLISRETRNQVTVALSGDGGDEVFAGYSKYQAEAYVPYYRMVPGVVWSIVRKLLANVPEGRQSGLHEYVRILKKFLRAATVDQVSRHCSDVPLGRAGDCPCGEAAAGKSGLIPWTDRDGLTGLMRTSTFASRRHARKWISWGWRIPRSRIVFDYLRRRAGRPHAGRMEVEGNGTEAHLEISVP